uniref:HAD hydrolase, family IA, variant 3 n=1 Tax=Haemonchus contortus TaxID=6289 RepID=A0A7I4Y5F8_HAECO
MPSAKPPVTHVIFDFDGLLVDTEPCYTLANQAMLKKYGKEFTMELKGGMMGCKNMEAIAWLLEQVGIADCVSPEEYVIEYDAMLADMFRKCNSMPGAERLVRHLASKGAQRRRRKYQKGQTFPGSIPRNNEKVPAYTHRSISCACI